MCTNFSIKSIQNDPFIGRTMELGPDLGSVLFFRPKGYQFTQMIEESTLTELRNNNDSCIIPLDNLESITGVASWCGKYGFAAMNAFGQDICADGINTAGLTTGCMVFAASEYQKIPEAFNSGKHVIESEANMIYYTNLSNWILSSCGDCQDVIDGLKGVRLVKPEGSTLEEPQGNEDEKYIVTSPFCTVPNAYKFHFPVHDAKGQNIVLEYINGELIITDLAPINVLTNDPEISWQQTNVINNCIGVTPYNAQDDCGYSLLIAPEKEIVEEETELCTLQKEGIDTCTLKEEQNIDTSPPVFNSRSFAQGTGFAGIPGSSTPVDRFVRAAMMTNFAFKTCREGDPIPKPDYPREVVGNPVSMAFHILNTVDIPMGTSRDFADWKDPINGIHDYTQWSTVSDLKKREYSIRMYHSPQVFLLKLDDLDLQELVNTHYKIPSKNSSLDITNEIRPAGLEVI